MRQMAAALALLLVASNAFACSCRGRTQDWFAGSQNVVLIRVTSVESVTAPFFGSGKCTSGPNCYRLQSASFEALESFKGSLSSVRELRSHYDNSACGIPLVAGAYYVVFKSIRHSQIGRCNTAGPYAPEGVGQRAYPRRVQPFLQSLRVAARKPGTATLPIPHSIPFVTANGS